MNFTKMILLVFIVQLSLVVLGIADMPGSSLYLFLTNPTGWDTSAFSLLLSDLFIGVGGAMIVVGSFFIKNDILIFAGLASIFFSFGKGLSELWVLVNAQAGSFIANAIISPIILLYVMCVIAWWRTRES